MSVVAKQKPVEQLYEYQVRRAAGFAVFDSVSSIHQRLQIFRTHHLKCAARRKDALNCELRQENQRKEWLKRKYMDTMRQHQQTASARVDPATSNPRFEVDHGHDHPDQSYGGDEPNASKPCSDSKVKVSNSPPPVSRGGDTVKSLPDANTLVKREPETDDQHSSPTKVGTEFTYNHGLELKRQSKKTDSVKWSSLNGAEDTRDELKLTAYDVIAGVINTHPIQPLEQDSDSSLTQSASPSSSVKLRDGNMNSVTATASASATPITSLPAPPPSNPTLTKNKDQHSLVQDLDEFSKVMHRVTQEQIAKERRVSFGTELEPPVYPNHSRTSRHLDPPPYFPIRQSCSERNGDYYHPPKYTQQAPLPQVDSVYQPKSVTQPQVLTSDPPVSNVPVTPTTPLEHFSNFHSPPPPPHLTPLTASHSPGPPACPLPPPYSSTATMSYPYSHNPVYQTAASSGEWSLQSHPLHSQPTNATQEKLKDTILARVNSCVVALAGQKRPIQGSLLPPAKLALLGHHQNTSATLHGYPSPTVVTSPYPTIASSPYPGSSTIPSFPH